MALKKTAEDRAVRVNITLTPAVLESIDKNVERIQRYLIRNGVEEKLARMVVSRSSLIKEMVSSLGTEVGFQAIKTGFCAGLGVNTAQTELFKED